MKMNRLLNGFWLSRVCPTSVLLYFLAILNCDESTKDILIYDWNFAYSLGRSFLRIANCSGLIDPAFLWNSSFFSIFGGFNGLYEK